jgi:hypothetical protein
VTSRKHEVSNFGRDSQIMSSQKRKTKVGYTERKQKRKSKPSRSPSPHLSELQLYEQQRERQAYTYTNGPTLISTHRNFTTHDVCDIIDYLSGYSLVATPEPITEGGLLVDLAQTYPSIHEASPFGDEAYKSCRISMDHFPLTINQTGKWPWIPSLSDVKQHPECTSVVDFWRRKQPDTVITKWKKASSGTNHFKGVSVHLCFKAFYGAPLWTAREVQLVINAFVKGLGEGSEGSEGIEGGFEVSTKIGTKVKEMVLEQCPPPFGDGDKKLGAVRSFVKQETPDSG